MQSAEMPYQIDLGDFTTAGDGFVQDHIGNTPRCKDESYVAEAVLSTIDYRRFSNIFAYTSAIAAGSLESGRI